MHRQDCRITRIPIEGTIPSRASTAAFTLSSPAVVTHKDPRREMVVTAGLVVVLAIVGTGVQLVLVAVHLPIQRWQRDREHPTSTTVLRGPSVGPRIA